MGFMDSLKGVIWNDPAAAPAASTKPTAAAAVPGTAPALAAAPGLNTEMLAAIKKAVFGRNTAYTQLLTAAEALADVIPDPTMRLKAAHKTGAAGRTVQQITAAVDVHLQDVDGEELRFKTMLDQKAQEVGGNLKRQSEVARGQATAAAAEIERLQQRITELTTAIAEQNTLAAQADASYNEHTAGFAKTEQEFKAAAQAVRAELIAGKTAISTTLA